MRAYRLTEEDWWQWPAFNELKLRGSWGEMGNQNIGLYRYFGSVAFGQNYLFGETLTNGAAKTGLANRDYFVTALEISAQSHDPWPQATRTRARNPRGGHRFVHPVSSSR